MIVLYLFAVAAVNVGLGFAVAVHLGRRYRALVEPGATWVEPPRFGLARQVPLPSQARPAPGPAALGAPAEPPAATAAIAPPERAAEETAAESPTTPAEVPPPGPVPQTALLDEGARGPSEPSVESLRAEMEQYQGHVTQADEDLRQYAGNPDAAAIMACLDSLLDATDEYLNKRNQAVSRFLETHGKRADFESIHGGLRSATEEQDKRIKSTEEAIRAFDYQSDLTEGCRAMVHRTTTLIEGNHQFRDALEETAVEVADVDQGIAGSQRAPRDGIPAAISSRAALGAALRQWWLRDPHRTRHLSLALVDLDQFGQINERHGNKVGDTILRAIGPLLEAENRPEATLARLSGQRFVFLFPDEDVRLATNVVERARQVIEMSHFHVGQVDARATVSCAVTESDQDDTTETLIARAEATLREAKRYGRNRTFLHDGQYPTPVVPPNFALEENHLTL